MLLRLGQFFPVNQFFEFHVLPRTLVLHFFYYIVLFQKAQPQISGLHLWGVEIHFPLPACEVHSFSTRDTSRFAYKFTEKEQLNEILRTANPNGWGCIQFNQQFDKRFNNSTLYFYLRNFHCEIRFIRCQIDTP